MAERVELYLIRHGLAAERGDAYPDDTKRPLTSRGIARLKKEARGLIELDVVFDVILTSALVRARQTADVLAAALPSRPPIVIVEALAPGSSYGLMIDELARHARRHRIAVVGHQPGVDELGAKLIGAKRPVDFKKGAICRIDLETLPPTGPGHLRWFLAPRMLRKIGK